MNLIELKTIVANYHQKGVLDLTQNGVDMFLSTVNQLRQQAELRHNFEYCRCRALLNVDGVTGGSLDNAVIFEPEGQVSVVSTDPTVTGTYDQLQVFNGYWAYFSSALTMYIYYNSFYNSYIISNALVDGVASTVWKPAVNSIIPWGTYLHITNSSTPATATFVSEFAKVREVVACQNVASDGTLYPLDFTRADIPIERDRFEVELDNQYWPERRYPSDASIVARMNQATLIQRRRKILLYPACTNVVPTQPLSVQLEAYGQIIDWAETDFDDGAPEPNWFLLNGYNWLKWASIYELNPLYSTFVPRQEGNVNNDAKALIAYREEAWQAFLSWDDYQIDSHTTRSR